MPPASSHSTVQAAAEGVGFVGFVLLAAALMSTQALAIDTMLPALPAILHSLKVLDVNRGQWIITAYVTGVGVGQLIWGPLSDRYGRRPILLGGLALYTLAAILSGLAQGFTALLMWRFIHGLAAASAVVARSVVRDLYSGRHMARVISLTFIVVMIVPVIGPSLGQLILLVAPWRGIFLLFGAYSALVGLWAFIKLPETLHSAYRMTLTWKHLGRSARLVLGNRDSLCYTLAGAIVFSALLAYLGMVQQIYEKTFHIPHLMPAMFALSAASMAATSLVNSRIVERKGMRFISHSALLLFIGFGVLHLAIVSLGLERLWTFVLMQSVSLACFSFIVPNFGAMAMQPLAAVAGIAASLQGFITMCGGALIGAAIASQFDGTTRPLVLGMLLCGMVSLCIVLWCEGGSLFGLNHPDGGFAPGKTAERDAIG
jgi:MFS transporter, DHA1 family, multidrug resistance protein